MRPLILYSRSKSNVFMSKLSPEPLTKLTIISKLEHVNNSFFKWLSKKSPVV